MTYLDFLREKIGHNWVIARRTPNIVARYGEDVVCISKQRMRAIDKEYRALYGDPYDKVRAELYLALIAMCSRFEATGEVWGSDPAWLRASAALEAERNAR